MTGWLGSLSIKGISEYVFSDTELKPDFSLKSLSSPDYFRYCFSKVTHFFMCIKSLLHEYYVALYSEHHKTEGLVFQLLSALIEQNVNTTYFSFNQ